MDSISEKINGWIGEGKDVRSAHWQGALEKMMDVFSPVLEPGKLVPVQGLASDDLAVFTAALEAIDLSPGLLAVFLPPPIAGNITPPESAGELQRIDKGKPSYKILIARPGKALRVMCAEISDHAKKPGVDIFQSGALLGTYDYHNQKECLEGLTPTVRVHIWEKGPWRQKDYKQYTMNWFEKVMLLGKGTIPVEKSCSFLHSPTLIKSNRIDAIFTLIHGILIDRFTNADGPDQDVVSSIRNIADVKVRADRFNAFAEERVLALLNVIRDGEIIEFSAFSNREAEQFKQEFPGTVQRIARQVIGERG
ncbi:MAG: hypothetical protein JEZ11_08470 [Desulfobacterales bacterium]|nr:hypothetical protein [Desulfobacterales bacterium]